MEEKIDYNAIILEKLKLINDQHKEMLEILKRINGDTNKTEEDENNK